MEESTGGAVFVQTNAEHNEVIAFARTSDGMLTETGRYATGGAGDGVPHLTSQGAVTLTTDRAHLLVTNAASDDVSVFEIGGGGTLMLTKTVPAGAAPKSVAEHHGTVFVLATGDAAINGYRSMDGDLVPTGTWPLSSPDAAQVGFTPDGRALVVTERFGDKISSWSVTADATLGARRTIDSLGFTPYGFAISPQGVMVVTEAFRAEKGAAAASSYTVDGDMLRPGTASVRNGRSEICWAVITGDGRFAFTTNFADGAVSRYAIGEDGGLTLEDAVAGLTEDGSVGLRDEDLTDDGAFLYAIDTDRGRIVGWSVSSDGALSPAAEHGGLPSTIAGLAAI
jgi:6-phosphogluconolactonase (cycloisomerase 2 family)